MLEDFKVTVCKRMASDFEFKQAIKKTGLFMWNYRVMNVDESEEEDTSLEMREVYYDKQGEPYGHCSAEVFGNDLEEMDRVLTNMRQAFDKPILTKADFTGDPSKSEAIDVSDDPT